MKYQFQFAGADVKRPVLQHQHRNWLRLGMIAGACLLAASLCYWYYFVHLPQNRLSNKLPVSASAARAAAPSKAAAVNEPPATLPPALERAANAGVLSIGTLIVETVKIQRPVSVPFPTATESAPALPVPVPVPVAKPESPGFKIVSMPTEQRLTRVLTPEQKMERAAQAALDRMLGQANKYPDAYGFLPEDNFAVVRLGNAIPVFSVAEKDRADYKSGQAVKPILKPTQEWMFPVLAGDRLCCMVQVSYNGRDFVPGAATKSLAMAWTKITAKWPEAEGFHPHLIVNPEIPGFFFTIPELEKPNLTDTDQMAGFHPGLSPADVILASWR